MANLQRWLSLLTILALLLCTHAQDEAEDTEVADVGEEKELGQGCPFEVTVPWSYTKTVTVDISEDVEVDKDDPLALSTVCTCPATKHVSTTCTCEGPKEDDCDAYAQMVAGTFLTAEKFMGVFMHMDSASKAYHLQNIAFWTILGQMLSWLGLIILVYSEIKTVIIVREKDERDRLVALQYLRRNDAETARLNKQDEEAMVPRPYLSVGGGLLLSLGLVCQFTPFCSIVSLLLPGLGTLNDWCAVFVFVGAFVIAGSLFLVLVGLMWSCTRRYAALLLIALGLLGNIMLLGGLVSIVVWVAVTLGVLYAYFKWAPEYYEEQGQPYPSWLEDLGNIVRVGTSMEELKEAMHKGGEALQQESRDVVGSLPLGKRALQGIDSTAKAVKQGVGSLTAGKAAEGGGGEDEGGAPAEDETSAGEGAKGDEAKEGAKEGAGAAGGGERKPFKLFDD